MPFTICFTSMLPPFSRGGIVRRQRSLLLPVAPHTSLGSASFGSGGSTKPPAFMRASSRWNMTSVSFGPGAVPIVPVNPLNRTFTPGMSGEVAEERVRSHRTIWGFGKRSRRKPKPGTMTV